MDESGDLEPTMIFRLPKFDAEGKPSAPHHPAIEDVTAALDQDLAEQVEEVSPGDLESLDGEQKTPAPVASVTPRAPAAQGPTGHAVAIRARGPAPKVDVPAPTVEVPAPKPEVPAPKLEVPVPKPEAPAPKVEVTAPTVDAPSPPVEPLGQPEAPAAPRADAPAGPAESPAADASGVPAVQAPAPAEPDADWPPASGWERARVQAREAAERARAWILASPGRLIGFGFLAALVGVGLVAAVWPSGDGDSPDGTASAAEGGEVRAGSEPGVPSQGDHAAPGGGPVAEPTGDPIVPIPLAASELFEASGVLALPATPKKGTYAEAREYCRSVRVEGYGPFRLPELAEVATLAGAADIPAGLYWSHTGAGEFGDRSLVWSTRKTRATPIKSGYKGARYVCVLDL